MPGPSIVNDGPRFFPNVLKDQTFQREGVLFGMDPGGQIGLHWAVVDPRKHKLYVWEKDGYDFLQHATGLGASVFSNAAFNEYLGGTREVSTWNVMTGTLGAIISAAWRLTWQTATSVDPQAVQDAVQHVESTYVRLSRENWGGGQAHGYIIGGREGIDIRDVSRAQQSFFGRRTGRFFADYVIQRGDTEGVVEGIGALFRSVENYAPVDPQVDGIGAGFWGLAPLDDPQLQEARIEDAIEDYLAHEEFGRAHTVDGLIITAFHWGPVIDTLLAGIRVRDAVRVDGNDSILLGHGTSVAVGAEMPDYKRLLQRWGYQFRRE